MIEFLVALALALYCAETLLKIYRRVRPAVRRWLRERRERADRWAVFLEEIGPRKIWVIKVVREHTNMNLDVAKKAAEGVPHRWLATDLLPGAAKLFAQRLTEAGARVRVINMKEVPKGVRR